MEVLLDDVLAGDELAGCTGTELLQGEVAHQLLVHRGCNLPRSMSLLGLPQHCLRQRYDNLLIRVLRKLPHGHPLCPSAGGQDYSGQPSQNDQSERPDPSITVVQYDFAPPAVAQSMEMLNQRMTLKL